ncbi:MAG: hypothetical protein R2716_13695 [Microthrixaceae bacterium]
MRLVRFLAVVVVGVLVAFLVGMRTKSPLVLGLVRRMNRAVMNPMQMRSAGTPGAYASIIRHQGRSSGRTYETPVVVEPTGEGFVIALPYGDRADWVRNVLAAGSATIVHEDETFEVSEPELVPMEQVADSFPEGDQQAHRLFAVDTALRWGHKAPLAASV